MGVDNNEIRRQTKELALNSLKFGSAYFVALVSRMAEFNGWSHKKNTEIIRELISAGRIVRDGEKLLLDLNKGDSYGKEVAGEKIMR